MTALAVFLLIVGGCDLLRAARDTTSLRRRLVLAALGLVLLGIFAVFLEMDASELAGVGVVWATGFLLWLFGSASALTGGGALARTVAFIGLGGGLLAAVLAEGGLSRTSHLLGEMPTSLSGSLVGEFSPAWLLLVLGVFAVQLSTANIAVRLVLDAVGVPATTNEKRLKGGRMLGPMERLFILGLGLAGEVTAAAIVVAAKGLLRFPELQRGDGEPGPTDVTEYFLIGSFASWLVALGGLGLVVLAR